MSINKYLLNTFQKLPKQVAVGIVTQIQTFAVI